MLRGRWCDIIFLNVHAPTEDKIDDVKGKFYKDQQRVLDKFPKYLIKIVLEDFSVNVGREEIFKPTVAKERLHGIRVVNSGISKNLFAKSTMFPHPNINKFTWTSPDGKTHNEIEHISIDWRQQSSIPGAQLFRAADCGTDHYLVVAKVRKRLAMSRQTTHKVHMERFNLKKLNEVEDKEQYCVEISNRFTDMEKLDTEVGSNRT
jgi:hypothetical protein